MAICIWCGEPSANSPVEHIFPEALGCPDGFVLKDCVCGKCNHGLSHLDQALLHEFELIAFMRGVPRKNGKPPVVDTWASLSARYVGNEPEIHLNAGPGNMEAHGKRLPAARSSEGLRDFSVERKGVAWGTISWSQEIGRNPKMVRALYKVAFEAIAHFEGPTTALAEQYDDVRKFVQHGIGEFKTVMLGNQGTEGHMFTSPYRHSECLLPVVGMTIFGMGFIQDMDPKQKNLASFVAKLRETGAQQWTILPA